MIYFLIGLMLLLLIRAAMRYLMSAEPQHLVMMGRRAGQVFLYLLALLVLVRGQIDFALALAALGFFLGGKSEAGHVAKGLFHTWLIRRFGAFGHMFGQMFGAGFAPNGFSSSSGFAGNPFSQQSQIRTRYVDMMQDITTRHISGKILAGQFAGQKLEDLTQAHVLSLYQECLQADPQGAALLEFYLNRRFAGWRQAGEFNGNGSRFHRKGARGSTMRRDEAYKILGLAEGASREAIIAAHRALMKKVHPDLGGSSELAAKVNEAKTVLLE